MKTSRLRGWLLTSIAVLSLNAAGESARLPVPSRPPAQPQRTDSHDGYCPTWEGLIFTESIESAVIDIDSSGEWVNVRVGVCLPDSVCPWPDPPCGEYDPHPEFVNAWIDWNRDCIWAEPDERVMDLARSDYIDIHYEGTMMFEATVPLPDGVVGTRKMRVNLGWGYDANDPCELGSAWPVRDSTWLWGHSLDFDVDLYSVAVTRISVLNDLPMKGIDDPIWCMTLNQDGTVTDDTPPGDRLIAAPTTTDSIYLQCEVDSLPPGPSWVPRVKCAWSYRRNDLSGEGSFTGWEGSFGVPVPDTVGLDTLSLRFSICDENGNKVREQHAVIPTYVTFDTPHPKVTPPESTWVDRACRWADGACDAQGVADSLNAGIYCMSGGIYEAYVKSWPSYVGGGAGQKVDCQTFSRVWQGLSWVHGLQAAGVMQNIGSKGRGFVTKAATSADSKTGNAYPAPVRSIHDRWVFGMHQVGTVGDAGLYWDPTFNQIYAGIDEYIEWNVIRRIADSTFLAESEQIVKLTGNYVGETWPECTYGAASASRSLGSSSRSWAHFTGNFADTVADEDGDGWYDHLCPAAEVQVTQEGVFRFGAWVFTGLNQQVTSRRGWNDTRLFYLMDTFLSVGTHYVPLPFSGEDIFRSGEDGPYSVGWSLRNDSGVFLDAVTQVTAAYSHTIFGELPMRIQGLVDAGIDTDGDGLYDILRCSVSVLLSQKGDYDINAGLTVGDSQAVAHGISIMDSVGPGVAVFRVDFPGPEIWEHGLDGPYNVGLWLHHDKGFVEDHHFITGPYRYTDFDPPAVRLNGLPTVTPFDLGSDGRYDSLIITLSYLADSASWNLGWIGYLQDPDGGRIATAKALSTGDTVHLAFFGQDIYKSGRSGPYRLSPVGVSSPRGSFRFYDVCTTPAYTYDQFEAPPPPSVTFVGNYSDSAVDVTGNGLYDYLVVSFEVTTPDSGGIGTGACLWDGLGDIAGCGTGYVSCPMGEVRRLYVYFPGRQIRELARDGPYYLNNATVYHTDDPYRHLSDTVRYATTGYTSVCFDPGFLCGDINGDSSGPNIADLTYFIAFMWRSGPSPPVLQAANVDGSANGVNVADVTYLIAYIFRGGSRPHCPTIV